VSLLATAAYLRLDLRGPSAVEDLGFLVFGSVFLSRRVEVFGQFDAVLPLGAKAAHPPGFASGQPGVEPTRTVTTGASFYVIPDANRLKVQLDIRTLLDGQTLGLAPPDESYGTLTTTGPQVAGRVQLVAAL
jgi:hypothetical protein